MPENTLTFDTSSPEELKNSLPEQLKKAKPSSRFIDLAVNDPHIIARPFMVKDAPLKDIKKHLSFEAVELLSLPISDIEFDFKILKKDAGNAYGILACVPKKTLKKYLNALSRSKLIPEIITSYPLSIVNAFLSQEKFEGRVALLDFSKEKNLNLTVYHDGFELFRCIPYENLAEAKNEALQSLRSVCAKSSVKQFSCVYICGHQEDQKEMTLFIEQEFHAPVKAGITLKPLLSSSAENLPCLNLAKNYCFSPKEKMQIAAMTNISIAALLFMFIVMGMRLNDVHKKISAVQGTYNASQYNHALELKKKLKGL